MASAIMVCMKEVHLSRGLRLLTNDLLNEAADEFANHGCNDFNLKAYLSLKEQQEFVRAYHDWNGDPEAFDPQNPNLPDFAIMAFLAHLIKTEKF